MHTFVSELKKEAKTLDMSPTKLLKEAGFSDANWYNWTGNRSNPSEEIQNKLRETIQKMKNKTETPTAVKTLHAHSVPVAKAGEKTLNQVLTEKKDEIAMLQEQVTVLENILAA